MDQRHRRRERGGEQQQQGNRSEPSRRARFSKPAVPRPQRLPLRDSLKSSKKNFLATVNIYIHEAIIDQHLFTADRAAIEIFLRRRAKRFVQGFRRDRLVALATHTSLSSWLPAHHG